MTLAAERSRPATMPPSGEPGLVRGVRRWQTVALMINCIVGAGIFALPSRVDALAGPWGLLAFVACALIIASFALCFAEVSSRFSLSGGPYLYTQTAFGPLAGFLIGWLMWITRVTSLTVVANVMARYLAFFWAPAGAGWGRAGAMSAVFVALTLINLVGVRRAAGASTLLAIVKLVPLVLFVGVGLYFIDPHPFAEARLPDPGALTQSVLVLIFAFGGFEAVVVAAGEMREPRRDMPFALLVSIGGATLLYILIQAVCIGTLPGLAASQKPLADASVRFIGSAGASVIAAGALISTVGTLCATLLVGPRVLFAISEQGQLPHWFASTHARFHTPHVAILMTAGVGLALSISGTFTYLLGINVIARLTAYLSTAAALLVFRRVGRDRPALFSVPAGGFVATLALAACAWLLARSGARELRDVGIALAAGLCVFAADRWWRARRVAPAAAGS